MKVLPLKQDILYHRPHALSRTFLCFFLFAVCFTGGFIESVAVRILGGQKVHTSEKVRTFFYLSGNRLCKPQHAVTLDSDDKNFGRLKPFQHIRTVYRCVKRHMYHLFVNRRKGEYGVN